MSWHNTVSSGWLTASSTSMGCGIMQVYGVSNYYDSSSLKEHLIDLAKQVKKQSTYQCGTFIATLGKAYYNKEKYLIEAGFFLLKEYDNLAHPKGDTQRLYMYLFDRKTVEKFNKPLV